MPRPVVIVTGGASGIGRATCQYFHEEDDARIVVADVREEPRGDGQPTHRRIEADGGEAMHVETDVRDRDSVDAMVDAVMEAYGRVDVMVNNAGIIHSAPIDDLTAEEWRETIDVNLHGVFHGTTAALPHVRDTGGAIVNVSSGLGKTGMATYSAYCASKFGVIGFTEAVAMDLKDEVVVNAVCPRQTATAMNDFDGDDPARVAQYIHDAAHADYTGRAVDVR